MKTLQFRAPGRATRIESLAARAWLHAHPGQITKALAAGRVAAAGTVVHDPNRKITPGTLVTMNVHEGSRTPVDAKIEILELARDFCVVNKPAGWPSHAARDGGLDARMLVATALDRAIDDILPVHRLDAEVSGVWLIALDAAAAARLSQAFERSQVAKEYRALTPAPAWSEGVLLAGLDGRPAETRFRVLSHFDGGCELSLEPVTGRTHQLRRHLADAHVPILADPLYGGAMISGGLRLYNRRLAIEAEGIDVCVSEPTGFRCDEPVVPRPRNPVPLEVSEATMTALGRGHPWILTDSETGDVAGLPAGTLARVHGPRTKDHGLFRIEGPGSIAARRWCTDAKQCSGVEQRIARALERRQFLLESRVAPASERTSCFRLVHGEADGLPGVHVDLLDDELRVVILGRACESVLESAVDILCDALEGTLATRPSVVLVKHFSERPKGRFLSVEVLRGHPRDEPFRVRERGLVFEVDHGLSEPWRSRPGFGLYIDQRENRARIAELVAARGGGRWLNLFSHTGAFSVALLTAGAESVVSVDLSRPYLDALERNLEHNALDPKLHESVKMDAPRYLERLAPRARFDGIILDPPTAAAAGRRFWSVKKQQAELLAACLTRLSPGGVLLACRNDRGMRGTIESQIEQAARSAGVRLRDVEAAPPGHDFPASAGFAEGDSFRAALATRAR